MYMYLRLIVLFTFNALKQSPNLKVACKNEPGCTRLGEPSQSVSMDMVLFKMYNIREVVHVFLIESCVPRCSSA